MPGQSKFEPTVAVAERVPPTLDRAETTSISRGVGPQRAGCSGGSSSSSCDDLGSFAIAVAGHDDLPGEVGFLFELASGSLPSGLTLRPGPVRARNGAVSFVFLDGAEDDQESLDLTLRVFAIDASGNRSEPRVVAVSHPGSGGGCGQIAPARVSSIAPGCAALLLVALRLRRRRA